MLTTCTAGGGGGGRVRLAANTKPPPSWVPPRSASPASQAPERKPTGTSRVAPLRSMWPASRLGLLQRLVPKRRRAVGCQSRRQPAHCVAPVTRTLGGARYMFQ